MHHWFRTVKFVKYSSPWFNVADVGSLFILDSLHNLIEVKSFYLRNRWHVIVNKFWQCFEQSCFLAPFWYLYYPGPFEGDILSKLVCDRQPLGQRP
jgi:hypothetical protein